MRKKGVLLVVGGVVVLALGLVGVLARQSREEQPPAPSAAATVDEISTTPRPVQVVMRRGADRVLQRERAGVPCSAGVMGCPGSIELWGVTIFLVRDEGDALHAFIGEDPRNGCALEWLPERPELQQRALFHDVCH